MNKAPFVFVRFVYSPTFSETNGKDTVEHIEYYLKIIDPIKLPNVDHDKLRVVVFPILLAGRPFLATTRAMIDVFNKKITLRVWDDEVIFDVDQLIKRPTTEDDECYGIDDLDDTINEEAQELLTNEEPDSFLSRGLEKSIEQSDLEYCESADRNNDDGSDSKNSIRRINSVNTPYQVAQETTKRDEVKSEHLYSASANEIDEKKLELKNLPQHLEYAYLHGDKSFPVIISSKLSEKEKNVTFASIEETIFPNSNRSERSRKTPSPVLKGLFLPDKCRFGLCHAPALSKMHDANFTTCGRPYEVSWRTSKFCNSFDCCLDY
ncbi:hypothetical protein Tco_1133136 [Tanacetum coccineum]|uniref:Reverse transcriptase domain-containing protein n=1 Tax=Tanacetum coccineum TaxID=301880 RepID=A0ABQ5JDW3_9ASTR